MSPLLTDDQFRAEEAIRTWLAAPEMDTARDAGRRLMRDDRLSETRDGSRLLDRTLDLWLSRAALMLFMRTRARPVILWAQGIRPYRFRDRPVPASAVMMDNPDFIYRSVRLDGARNHVLSGRGGGSVGELTLQFTSDHDGRSGFVTPAAEAHFADFPIFDVADFERDPDGSFRVTIGPAPGDGRNNHISVPPCPFQILFRDVCNDWRQSPATLAIASDDGLPDQAELSDADAIRQLASDFPDYVSFWLRFKDAFSDVPHSNRPIGPAGNWNRGINLKARFELQDDEALVATTRDIGASYSGVQIGDVWLLPPDPVDHISSLSRAQRMVGEDGNFTCIVSREDPGLANWIDTAGSREGFLSYRWFGTSPDEDLAEIVRDFAVVKMNDLASRLPDHPRVSPADRVAERARRQQEWNQRVANG